MCNFIKSYVFYLGAVILLFPYHAKMSTSKPLIEFSKENFFVQFNPPKSSAGLSQNFTQVEIKTFIETVGEQFRNMFIAVTENCDEADGLMNITKGVALYNKNLSDTTSAKRSVTVLSLVRLLSQFDCFTKSGFTIGLEIAEAANSISSGTVGYLVLNDNLGELSRVPGRDDRIIQAKNQLSKTTSEYKLGILVSLETTLDFQWLKMFDIIILSAYPQNDDYKSGPLKTAIKYYDEFKSREKEIRGLNSIADSIEMAFLTRWSSVSTDGIKNFSKQVHFWNEMNKLFAKSNTKIFLERSFDDSNKYDTEETGFGWWKLTPDKSTDTGYKFTDKQELLKQDEEANKPRPFIVSLTIYVGSAVGALLTLICFRRIYYYFYMRRRQLLTTKELQTYWEKIKSADIKFTKFSRDSFHVLDEMCLGSGEFGQVCHGTLLQDSENVKVAVKMTKQPCTAIVLRSLLSELKILASIGSHDNLIGLVGACTENLNKNELFIFLELCKNGTLENYLRKDENLELDRNLGRNLLRWSYEISCGMEYIASKNIVHMDIATRNVLLFSDLTAKISDFGLSRRLYDYQMYTKKNQEPLPWRWMAPESLQRLQFTEKSDVWSFGVTLWEIFSIGYLPYAGIIWDTNFFRVLEAGLRLSEPKYNPQDIYKDVIRPCWELNADERPSFCQLKSMLEIICNAEAEIESLQSSDIGRTTGGNMIFVEPEPSLVGYTSVADLV